MNYFNTHWTSSLRLFTAAWTMAVCCRPTALIAADGPNNTGTLTLTLTEAEELQGHLQVDRKALSPIFGEDTMPTADDLGRLFLIRTDDGPCTAEGSGLVAAGAVLTAA